jgi:hemerythrin-like metal-binding protein
MKDLVWSNTLSVEVKEIDEDHHKLVDLFNMLNHSVLDGEKPDYTEAVLEELISCTAWHFRHEERLMVKYGYEEYQEHKAEHEDLIESARELQQKCLKEGKQISGEEIEFLEHWLTSHIFTTDMKLGAYLAGVM